MTPAIFPTLQHKDAIKRLTVQILYGRYKGRKSGEGFLDMVFRAVGYKLRHLCYNHIHETLDISPSSGKPHIWQGLSRNRAMLTTEL